MASADRDEEGENRRTGPEGEEALPKSKTKKEKEEEEEEEPAW